MALEEGLQNHIYLQSHPVDEPEFLWSCESQSDRMILVQERQYEVVALEIMLENRVWKVETILHPITG